MTKADLIECLHETLEIPKKEASEQLEALLETMKEVIVKDKKLKLSRFGNFVVRHKNARKGRNPLTGEEIIITERHVLTFKPSQQLKRRLNENFSS